MPQESASPSLANAHKDCPATTACSFTNNRAAVDVFELQLQIRYNNLFYELHISTQQSTTARQQQERNASLAGVGPNSPNAFE